MTAITVTNEADTVINAVVAELIGGTILAASIFNRVEKTNSIDRFKETRLSGQGAAAIAAVANIGIEEFETTDLCIGNVLSLNILVANQKNTEVNLVTEVNRLVAAVKNLINKTPPATSIAFYAAGEDEITQRILWGTPEYDSDSNKSWVFGEIPVDIAFLTNTETSH